MDEFFDSLSRRLASTLSRRSALGSFLASVVLAGSCFEDLTGPNEGNSSNDCRCEPGYACCVRHQKCCKPTAPHHCENTRTCYQFFTGAQAACGNSYEICGGPVG